MFNKFFHNTQNFMRTIMSFHSKAISLSSISMSKLSQIKLLALLFTALSFTDHSATASLNHHRYNIGGPVPLYVNKVGPLNNPRYPKFSVYQPLLISSELTSNPNMYLCTYLLIFVIICVLSQ